MRRCPFTNMSAQNAAGLKKLGRNSRTNLWRPVGTVLANFTNSSLKVPSTSKEQAGMRPTMPINREVRRLKEKAKSKTSSQHRLKKPNKMNEMVLQTVNINVTKNQTETASASLPSPIRKLFSLCALQT